MILIALVTIFSKSGADPANVPISNLSLVLLKIKKYLLLLTNF